MKNKNTEFGIYSPRATSTLDEDIRTLEENIEKGDRSLNEEGHRYIYDLEAAINGPSPEWYLSTYDRIDFVVQYFDTEEGKKDLQDIASLYLDNFEVGQNPQDLLSLLMLSLDSNKELELSLKRLAIKSHRYMAEGISSGDINDTYEPVHFVIFNKPQDILSSIDDTLAIREIIRLKRKEIEEADIDIDCKDAARIVLDAYLKKTASILGGLYPDYVDLFNSVSAMPDCIQKRQLKEELEKRKHLYILAQKINQEVVDEVSKRFSWTMERWRNGVVKEPEKKDTTLSADLMDFSQTVEAAKSIIDENETENGIFSQEEIASLVNLKLNSDDAYKLVVHILMQNNILSRSEDFNQGHWPADSSPENPKIGVVVGPFPNLSYTRGWIKIPENLERTGFQQLPSGIFLVVAHELEHAFDGITSLISHGLKLSEVKTRGSHLIREGVGKSAEGIISRGLIGRDLFPSLTYYKAMEALLLTSSEIAAIRAFAYQAATESGLTEPTTSQWLNAENRTQRLISKYGINSGALVYLEQAFMARALSNTDPNITSIISANSGIDVKYQALLAPFGLLNTNRYTPNKPVIDCIEEYIRQQYL